VKHPRAFALLAASASISGLGDGLTRVAGPLLAASLTRSPLQVAGLAVAQLVASAALALPVGVLVDRVDRRAAMAVACGVRVTGVGALGFWLMAGRPSLPLLYAVYLIVGLAGVGYENAAAGMLPAVAERSGLERANGRLRSAEGLSQSFIAQPLAAWLFTVAEPAPFVLDAAGLLVVMVLTSRLPRVRPRGATGRLGPDMRRGLRWLAGSPQLRALALAVAVSNVGLGALFAVFVLIARQRLGVGALGYGVLLTFMAAGGLAGGLIAGRVVDRLGRAGALRVEIVTETLTYAGLLLSRDPVLVGAMLTFLSLQLAIFSSVSASLRQTLPPPEMLGRVHGAYRMASNAGLLAGAALGGLLSQEFGLTAPFWLGLAGMSAVLVFAWNRLGAS